MTAHSLNMYILQLCQQTNETMKPDKIELCCTEESTQTIYIPDPRLSVRRVLFHFSVLPTM